MSCQIALDSGAIPGGNNYRNAGRGTYPERNRRRRGTGRHASTVYTYRRVAVGGGRGG